MVIHQCFEPAGESPASASCKEAAWLRCPSQISHCQIGDHLDQDNDLEGNVQEDVKESGRASLGQEQSPVFKGSDET